MFVLNKGEDGTELSAAGQMETVLGVKGLDQVWLSLLADGVFC